jgi:hypothetical protein
LKRVMPESLSPVTEGGTPKLLQQITKSLVTRGNKYQCKTY